MGDSLSLVLDDGPSRYQEPSTVVQVKENDWSILREGVFRQEQVRAMAGLMVLFVCTGNTCRSPMAENLLKKRLADYYRCPFDQLQDVLAAQPAATLDARGQARDSGVVEAMRAMTDLHAGDVLEVLAEGPGSPASFARWADRAGHSLLAVERAQDAGGRPAIRLLIEKA